MASDQLYEGNYAEWRANINSMLRRFNLLGVSVTPWDPAYAADLIAEQVQPSLLARAVPSTKRCDPVLLLRRLEEATRPFRFMELPAELRVHIYELLLREVEVTPIRSQRPAITQASQQLREEALPVYYEVSRFAVEYDLRTRSLGGCAAEVRKWAETIRPARLKLVREVRLRLVGYKREQGPTRFRSTPTLTEVQLIMRCDPDGGLTIECPEQLRAELKREVGKHVTKVNQICKALGIEGGGAVVMGLITDPALYGGLVMARPS